MRAGITPPNHARANVVAVKEQSQMNALRKQAEQAEGSSPGGLKLPPGWSALSSRSA
jgi:hypothetical protein